MIKESAGIKESVVLGRGSVRKIANPVREGAVAARIRVDHR
jgi:hypothetical protein